MSIFSFKNLKKSSVYITPNFPSLETKRYKIKVFKIIWYFSLLLLSIIILLSLAFAYTPLNKIVMYMENDKFYQQAERITELEEKLVIMTKELNRITNIDKRLKYAIILAQTDSLDSSAVIYDSLRKSSGNIIPEAGGSLIYIFEKIIDKYLNNDVTFINPVDGIIGKNFDPAKGHFGIDYLVSEGTIVKAPANGTVIFASYTSENGNVIIILHDEEYLSIFKHCSSLLKTAREDVVQGEPIALSGNSGTNTTGPHLHFELWKNAKPINPTDRITK